MKKRTNRKKGPKIEKLYNGDFVLIRGVSPALIDQVQAMVEDPKIPIVIANDGSELENPSDPSYHRELEKATSLRSSATVQGKTISACFAKLFQHHSWTITLSGFCQAFSIRLISW